MNSSEWCRHHTVIVDGRNDIENRRWQPQNGRVAVLTEIPLMKE